MYLPEAKFSLIFAILDKERERLWNKKLNKDFNLKSQCFKNFHNISIYYFSLNIFLQIQFKLEKIKQFTNKLKALKTCFNLEKNKK